MAEDDELGDMTKTNNPEAIDIDDDEEGTDEDEEVEGEFCDHSWQCI